MAARKRRLSRRKLTCRQQLLKLRAAVHADLGRASYDNLRGSENLHWSGKELKAQEQAELERRKR